MSFYLCFAFFKDRIIVTVKYRNALRNLTVTMNLYSLADCPECKTDDLVISLPMPEGKEYPSVSSSAQHSSSSGLTASVH